MADRKAAAVELGKQRLHIAQDGLACRRVAHMPGRRCSGKALDYLAAGKNFPRRTHTPGPLCPGRALVSLGGEKITADEPHPPLGMESPAIKRDDAGRFLAAV